MKKLTRYQSSALYLLLAASILTIAGSCKKEEIPEEYPSTFDIRFNGEPWFAPDFEDLKISYNAVRRENEIRQVLGIYASNRDRSTNYYHIYLVINQFKEGIHEIPTRAGQRHISRWDDLACGDYFIDQSKPRYFRVDHLNWEEENVQGFAEFYSFNNCGDSIHFEMDFDFEFETME